MHIALTFSLEATVPFDAFRTVYFAVDDEAGDNHIRRPLPHVDFQKLRPGESMTFEDLFLAPALAPGHYFVRLWIPDPDPKSKFDAARNLLLGNEGMAETTGGLNRIASVTIEKPSR